MVKDMKAIYAILFAGFAVTFIVMSFIYGSNCWENDFVNNKVNAQFFMSIVIVLISVIEMVKVLRGKSLEDE